MKKPPGMAGLGLAIHPTDRVVLDPMLRIALAWTAGSFPAMTRSVT